MSFVGHDRLRGDVELDETFVGGFAEGTGSGGAHARSSNITTVIVAAERAAETTIGRIRMARSLDSSVLCLTRFISDNVESGAILHTDGWPSYEPALKLFALEGLRYERRPVAMGSAGHDHDYLFGVHRAASLLKRWLLGHPPGIGERAPDRSLPGGVRLPLQPQGFEKPRSVVLGLVCALVETKWVGQDEVAARKAELVASDCQLALEIDRYVAGRSRRYRAKQAAKFTRGIPLG